MCAIHQPNLFPRLSTLAKLYAADRWIVLGDVQFARRDYQHRARLAALDEPAHQQWLTLPTHLPDGRPTLISQARLADPGRSRRTVSLLIRQYYGRSRHWPAVREVLEAVLDEFEATDRVSDVARASTVVLLTALGWSGEVLDSSAIPTRGGRSERLADLAAATGSTHCLCGTGGWRYLDPAPFDVHRIPVPAFHTPVDTEGPLWRRSREIRLYVVVCAAGVADSVGRLITAAQEANWDVGIVATPQGLGFVDTEAVEAQTGYLIRSAWRSPGDPRPLPPADAQGTSVPPAKPRCPQYALAA